MIIKKYMVKNMNEAMTRIRYELGKDAIIISQRSVRKAGLKGFFSPKLIEVTAALENNKGNNAAVKNDSRDDLKDSVESIKEIIKKNSFNREQVVEKPVVEKEDVLKKEVLEVKDLLNEILKNTNGEEKEDKVLDMVNELDLDNSYINEFRRICENSEEPKEELRKYLMQEIDVFEEEIKGKVVLVGPTGVGKTTTIAKLAGKLSLLEEKRVGLITVDTYRIGAVEQLKTYAEIMNIPFKVVITMKEMEAAIKEMEDLDVVLIDTTGRSSKNSMQISELRAFVQKAEPEHTIMVMSSITKNKDAKVILKGYEKLAYDKVIITKLDETATYGILHTVLKECKKPIAFVTTGQNVPDDIKVPKKELIVNLILGEETVC